MSHLSISHERLHSQQEKLTNGETDREWYTFARLANAVEAVCCAAQSELANAGDSYKTPPDFTYKEC